MSICGIDSMDLAMGSAPLNLTITKPGGAKFVLENVTIDHSLFMVKTDRSVLVPCLHEGKQVQFKMPFTMQRSLLEVFKTAERNCLVCQMEDASSTLQPVHRRFNFAT